MTAIVVHPPVSMYIRRPEIQESCIPTMRSRGRSSSLSACCIGPVLIHYCNRQFRSSTRTRGHVGRVPPRLLLASTWSRRCCIHTLRASATSGINSLTICSGAQTGILQCGGYTLAHRIKPRCVDTRSTHSPNTDLHRAAAPPLTCARAHVPHRLTTLHTFPFEPHHHHHQHPSPKAT